MIPKNGSQFAISEGESYRPGKLHLPFAAAAITEALPHAQHVADRWHVAVRRIGAYSIPFGERRG